jgi:hypothetical protein
MIFRGGGLMQLIACGSQDIYYPRLGYKIDYGETPKPLSDKSKYLQRKKKMEEKEKDKPKREIKHKKKVCNKPYKGKMRDNWNREKLTRDEKKQKKYDRLPMNGKVCRWKGDKYIWDLMEEGMLKHTRKIHFLGKISGFALICCWNKNKLECNLPRDVLRIIYWKLFEDDDWGFYYLYCGPLKEPKSYYRVCFNCRRFLSDRDKCMIAKRNYLLPHGYPKTIYFCQDWHCIKEKQKMISDSLLQNNDERKGKRNNGYG